MAKTGNIFDIAVTANKQELTVEDLKADAERQIVAQLAGAYNALRGAFTNVMVFIWQNPNKLTPKQVFSQLDVDGASLVSYSQAVLALLEKAHPGSTADLPAITRGWTLDAELDADGKPTGRIIVNEPA